MIAIETKYLPATNSRGSRIVATANGNRVSIPYPHELSGAAVYAEAALALCAKMGWEGDLLAGGTKSGYVFTFVKDAERFTNPTVDPRRLATVK